MLYLLSTFFMSYLMLISWNIISHWLDSLTNKKQKIEDIIYLALQSSNEQVKTIYRFFKKSANKLVELQNKKLQNERFQQAANGVLNELAYNFEQETSLRITNHPWISNNYICIPTTKNANKEKLISLESYLLGVVSKYTIEFSIDSITCQNLNGHGWTILIQLNLSEIANFNRLARKQEIDRSDNFNEDDELF